MEETIIELQTIIQHQEEKINHLSEELYIQQKELAKLKQQMSMLLDRFRALPEDANEAKTQEPPPPHY